MEKWYLKDIMSKLTITFLINYDLDKNFIFPDLDSWLMLYYIIQDVLHETEDDQMKMSKYRFDHDRKGYEKIIMAIPYMLIEKFNLCPCCVIFGSQFCNNLSAPGSIEYFKCDNKIIVFANQSALLQQLKTYTRPEEYSAIK